MNSSYCDDSDRKSTMSAIQELVHSGRIEFAIRLQAHPDAFDESFWDIRMLRRRAIERGSRLYFTRYARKNDPLPPVFAEVIKSIVILNGRSISHMVSLVDSYRLLWETILIRLQGRSEKFTWDTLCESDFYQTELMMHERFALSSTYRRACLLATVANILETRNICRHLDYVIQTPCPNDYNHRTFAGRESRLSKLPTQTAIEGLADIYRVHAKEAPDRLLAAAIAILVATGFRVGELLALPSDCEVEETYQGITAYGLRYYAEKVRGKEKTFAIRWLTPAGGTLVRRAVKEIRDITAVFRQQAKLLETNPGRVPILHFEHHHKMMPTQVQAAIGIETIRKIPKTLLPQHRDEDGVFYYTSDVETYLLAKRIDPQPTVDIGHGIYQLLSETLFIVPDNFFAQRKRSCAAFIVPITYGNIS